MSKRKWLLSSALLGAAAAAIPYFMGQYIEIKYKQFTDRVSEFEAIELDPLIYKRHWLYSEAETTVILRPSTWLKWVQDLNFFETSHPHRPNISFILEHKIQHGPLAKNSQTNAWEFSRAAINSHLSPTADLKKFIETEGKSTGIIQLQALMDLVDGDITIKLEGAPFKMRPTKEVPASRWGGIHATWQFNDNLDKLLGKLQMPGFDLNFNGANYQGHNLYFQTRRHRLDVGLWEGEGVIKIQELSAFDPENNLDFTASGISLNGVVYSENQSVNSAGAIRIESLVQNQIKSGPLSLNAKVNRVPSDIFLLLSQILRSADSWEEVPTKILSNGSFLASMPRFLAARPEVILRDIYWESPQGTLRGEAAFTLGGKAVIHMFNPHKLIHSVVASANFRIPKTMMQQLMRQYIKQDKQLLILELDKYESEVENRSKEWLLEWLNGGYLMDEGDAYRFDIQLMQGKLKINGTDFSLPNPY